MKFRRKITVYLSLRDTKFVGLSAMLRSFELFCEIILLRVRGEIQGAFPAPPVTVTLKNQSVKIFQIR